MATQAAEVARRRKLTAEAAKRVKEALAAVHQRARLASHLLPVQAAREEALAVKRLEQAQAALALLVAEQVQARPRGKLAGPVRGSSPGRVAKRRARPVLRENPPVSEVARLGRLLPTEGALALLPRGDRPVSAPQAWVARKEGKAARTNARGRRTTSAKTAR